MAGGVADALNTWNLGDVFNQQGKVGNLGGVAHAAAVGVDVLTQKRDFFHALRGETRHFGEHIIQGAVDFFASGVGHHAIAAVFGATFHDGNKRRGAFHPRGGQVIEFFNLGKADVNLRFFQSSTLVK